ncbi:Peroxin/Ferlin domain-containing protein [Caenorhabditis elegans]|uniref:Peroxin/Ferlin domain-containing protein n=1 Tax=Caenorhabditis elegans TaxID=6239 RepID=Q22088_CAEEL|nr:Peroxin/Ferlin domain-containing protein [Caenorhabditis elegans]CAA92690.2 Peroxin/Ferlin domain-containing protein [Caenorhabditis elegans]|eukprot:NP_495658.1 Uncharacterized protein CELE_T01H3.2 [Caenorhabditis elegans]
MPFEYIWTVSANGVACRIPSPSDPRCISEIEWKEIPCSDGSAICTIVASPTSAFAIDRSGRVLILVLPTHLAIRERAEIYNNQRWIGIWRGTFFIDRPRFSDESGRVSIDPSANEIDPGWSWEDNWHPHLDPRKYDKEGWQYSLSFLAPKWDKQCRMYHLVRRRVLKRNVRYTSHDQWIEMSNEETRMFTELAIGGMDVMGEGGMILFALGSDGNIYRRDGIHPSCPSGRSWQLISKVTFKDCESDDVTLISASPSLATLMAITWDGKMFHRVGITRQNQNGFSWKSIPTPKNKAVISASIGTRTMWCITADGCVWFVRLDIDEKLKEHKMENITSESYQMTTQGGISKISVTRNDQVFCVSTREKIEVRTGIEPREPSGKRFERIVDRGEPNDQKWISIHTGSVLFDKIPDYFMSSSSLKSKMEVLQFKKADWRLQILERLQETSDRSWSLMNSVNGVGIDSPEELEGPNTPRQIRCQLMQGELFRSVNITILNNNLQIYGDNSLSKSIDTSSIKSVLPCFQRLPQKYLLYVFIGANSDSECFAFTDEKSRTTFQSILETIIRDYICSSTRNSFGDCMWSISSEGVVRWHCLAEMSKESKFEKRVNPGESRGLVVDGLFESVDCGVKGSVWAINQSGNLYSLSSNYNPLSSHSTTHDYKMTDQITLKMFEYQKHAVFRGFISFQGSQKGISAWMCDNKPCPPSPSSLPSTNWSWIDSAWQLEEDTWKYSNNIDGVYSYNEKAQGKARRRVWRRQAKFELNKSPWCHVESPPIQCVRVSKIESCEGTIVVVVLTKDGHILIRNGVDREHFTGTNWTEILTDSPISSMHLQWEGMKLWCATYDGTILSRSLTNSKSSSFLSSSDWRHLDLDTSVITDNISPKAVNDIELTGYSDILYVRIKFILFRIDTKNETISDAYPMDNLQQAVVSARGSICLRGTNITVVRDWRVVPYTDRKATIIAMRDVERATNMGCRVESIAFY